MARIFKSWAEVRKHWSLWLGSVGTAFVSWFITSPETAVAAWAMIPSDLKSHLPHQLVGYFGIGLFILAMLAKFVNQAALKKQIVEKVP